MKRITSLIISLAIMVNTAAGISLPAAAESESIKEYIHNGYTVTYKVVSEWTGNQNVSVTIENTGEEEICGWALKYETPGTIGNIWNGKIYSENEDTRIISAQSYNNIIYAGNKVTFGYIISGENFEFPEEMILCNEWTEADEDVEISYEILDDWGSTYQAQVFISNNTEKEIDCWKLGFDFTGEISQIWNCVLLNQNESSAFVRNSGSTSIIAPDSEVSFSFIAKKDEDETPELSDFVLYENCINEEKEIADIALQLMGYADFTDDVLTINWYSTVEEGKFQILKSSDNENFEVIAELEDVLSYEYGAADFEKAYFKITQLAPDSRYTESAVIAVEYENGECNWEYLDTDEDGIPDVYEESIGTDINKPDTDDDGLTDYEELYLTNTDPLVYNSVNEELSDADADCDEDGISNKTEIENGTNPLLPDTDYDSINDGKEAELGTDPVNSDTDGDGIGDGDELVLNLDPTSDTTDGIKDNERTTVQEITADSEIMSEINTEENPMKVSIEFEAAGLAESSLDVSESGYSSAMSNSAIVGGIPEFSYPAGLSTGEVTVKFEVDDSVKANTVGYYAENCEELQGIKRFNVFKYFEDTNMLLPIETFHDEEQGIVYTKTDCLGTYCVMDLEIWMQNLGVEPEVEELTETTESVEYLSTETVDVSYLSSAATTETENPDDERLNVVFFLDARPYLTAGEFETIRDFVCDALYDVMSSYMLGVDISVMVARGGGYAKELKVTCFEHIDEIRALTNTTDFALNSNAKRIDITSCFDTLYDGYKDKEKDTLFIMAVHEENIMAEVSVAAKYYKQLSDHDKIHISLISETRTTDIGSYVVDLIKDTDGKIIKARTEAIKSYIGEYLSESYSIITANNYEFVQLKGMLKKDSGTDTDLDDCVDWDEVDIEAVYGISEQQNESIRGKSYLEMYDMPTIQQCLEYYNGKCFYVQSGLEKFQGEHIKHWADYIEKVRITPIISDPTNVDSDWDCIEDIDDDERLIPYAFSIKEIRLTPLVSGEYKSTICVYTLYNGDYIWQQWNDVAPDETMEYYITEDVKQQLHEYNDTANFNPETYYPWDYLFDSKTAEKIALRDLKRQVAIQKELLDNEFLIDYPNIIMYSEEYYGLWIKYVELKQQYDEAGLLVRDTGYLIADILALGISVYDLISTIKQISIKTPMVITGGSKSFNTTTNILLTSSDDILYPSVMINEAKATKVLEASNKSNALSKIDTLPKAIQENVKRFFKKSSIGYSDYSVIKRTNGEYYVTMTKPGDVPGSKAIYCKIISPKGNTQFSYKVTYDPKGTIVHIKPKN